MNSLENDCSILSMTFKRVGQPNEMAWHDKFSHSLPIAALQTPYWAVGKIVLRFFPQEDWKHSCC